MLNIGEISKPSVDKNRLKSTKELSEVDPVLAIQAVASDEKDNSKFTENNKKQLNKDSDKSSEKMSSSKPVIIEESLYDESGKPIPVHQVDIKI